MTTNASVKTHSWPVQVTAVMTDQKTGAIISASHVKVIPPNTESIHDIMLCSGRSILLTELPLPGKMKGEVDDPTYSPPGNPQPA